MAILPKNYDELAQQNAFDEGEMTLQDLLNANKRQEEPVMSQMAPADYEKMQSSVTPDMLYTTPKLSDILPEKQKPILPDNYNQLAQQEAFDQSGIEGVGNLQKQASAKAVPPSASDLQKQSLTPPAEETDLQRLEKKLQELRDLDLERQSTASKYNFGAKAAAIIGDALSKYQTGAIQKNVGAPVQFTGPSLQQMMSMIGEVKAPSSTEQRQALIDRYKEIKADQKAQNSSKEAKAAAELKYKRDLTMLDRKLGAEKEIAGMKLATEAKVPKLSVGEEVQDREFGKKYQEYITTGKGSYNVNKKSLENVINALETKQIETGFTGGLATNLGGLIGYKTDIAEAQDTVRSAVQSMLKPILGGQFAEKEAERVIQTSFDPKSSPEESIKKLKRELQKIEYQQQSFEDQATYFNKNRTLSGYEPIKESYTEEEQQALDWANKNPNDPKAIEIKNELKR